MAIEFREILDDELEVARKILDAAYGPSPARAVCLRRYRSLDPTTWLLALDDGEPVGLGGAIDYGTFAYIGLVGVLQDIQRRGIGRAIMARLLALIDARGGRTSLLDATDAGAALYRKMGFVDDDTVRLFHGEARGRPTAMARAMLRADLAAVAELDRRVGVADRTALLSAYFDEYEGRAFVVDGDGGGIAGFAFAQASVVGPWVAESDDAAEAAIDAALSCKFDGPLMIVVPGQNTAAASLLEARGFASTRQLVHMRLGEAVPRRRDRIYGQASMAAG
jgi:ribosomal protein S18 acetylase RimI-like enzyme